MNPSNAAPAAPLPLGRTAIFAPGYPLPAHLRRLFDDPVAKYLAAAKPHPALDGPPHPALEPNNALASIIKGEN